MPGIHAAHGVHGIHWCRSAFIYRHLSKYSPKYKYIRDIHHKYTRDIHHKYTRDIHHKYTRDIHHKYTRDIHRKHIRDIIINTLEVYLRYLRPATIV
jgi:protoheme ferro-lyase